MEKPTSNVSFAVGSRNGPRSARWIVSIAGDDVYISTGMARRSWHVSMHASGQWHLKEHREHVPGKPKTVLKSHRAAVPAPEYPVGLYVVIPDLSLRPASDPDNAIDPDHWLERPAYGGVEEFAFIRWDWRGRLEEWPGQHAGTQLVFGCPYPGSEVFLVLRRSLGPDHPDAHAYNDQVAQATRPYRPIVLDSPERRGYIAGLTPKGAITLTEFAID